MGTITMKDTFYVDDKPVKIISGVIHYFRTVPEYWRDRLEKLKAMGCNTVETYIPWNLTEPKRGEFCFTGFCDIERFIQTAADLGLYMIVRPSPYICAEWEFGGLPAWLLEEEHMHLRVSYEPFLKAVEEYYSVLIPKLVPHQITRGGNIILMQVENEYGYYGDDAAYMEHLKDLMIKYGVEVPLVTSDGPFEENLNCGVMKGVLPTGNFGSKTEERFRTLAKYTDGGPLMCTEFWVGWFDHWGNGGHMTGNLEESEKDLEKMLEMGHVNIYMFEGGTNFGFMNGSNYYDELTPDVTSYDYDGVLTEDGQLTQKYYRYRSVISQFVDIPEVTFSTKIIRKNYGTLPVEEKVSLFSVLDDLSKPVHCIWPLSMEQLGQSYGYILYHSQLKKETNLNSVRIWGGNDRAKMYCGQKHYGTLYDRELLEEYKEERDIEPGEEFDILVENMGRVNFGPRMEQQRKGITQCVQINGHLHTGWDIYTLPLDHLELVDFQKDYQEGTPAFYRFSFDVDEIGDTFLDFSGWGKGVAFLNGFNLGRFWEIGPQKRLYIPGPLLKKGQNEIILFETEGKHGDSISLVDTPDIG